MRLTLISLVACLELTLAAPYDVYSHWSPAGPGEVRGPCPMLNTLANHGILPHNGKNITMDITIKALTETLNFTPGLGTFLHNFATFTNPTQPATTFNLDHLGIHNFLEHDASLSRADDYFDPADTFNRAIFKETTSYWTSNTVDLKKAAKSRKARATTSVKTNPAFTFSPLALGFAYGEVAAIPLVFGNRPAGTFPKKVVTWFFENERLPVKLGWKKPAKSISQLDLCEMTQRVIVASGTTAEKAKIILPCSDFGVTS